jgi:hypothetical protein
MAFRSTSPSAKLFSIIGCVALIAPATAARGQVFVVGEKTATADISTDFKPTRVQLSTTPINERGRRELVRNLEAEQGFAHRALPLGEGVVLLANGNLKPAGEAYKAMIFKKGESVGPGDRVVITSMNVKPDRIIFDLNGGPYAKHRFLSHIEINDAPVVANTGEIATGCRITLIFEGGIPDVSAPEVKALLDPVIDFGAKTSEQAYAETLPPFLKDAVAQHDVLVGMNRKMVLAAMGAPENKERELLPGSADRHYEEWIYGHMPQTVRFVRIEGDRVTQVRVAALGQPIATYDKNQMEGYLDPENTREIAMGDGAITDPDQAHAVPAPSLRLPGDPDPPANAQSRVQYPPPTKEKPLPSADPTDSMPSTDSTAGLPTADQNGTPPSMGPGVPTGSTPTLPGHTPHLDSLPVQQFR